MKPFDIFGNCFFSVYQTWEISHFLSNFQLYISPFQAIYSMKGFSQFGAQNNINGSSSQPNQTNSQNSKPKNGATPLNNEKVNANESKEKQNIGFITVKKEHVQPLIQNQNHANRLPYQNHAYPVNENMNSRIQNNLIQNSGFGSYQIPRMQNPQFYPNAYGSFNQNPYSMIFNQFQNAVPSISTNQGSSETMIMSLFQIIETQAKSLQSLYGKVEKMTQKINQFGQKMKQMKKYKKEGPAIEQEEVKQPSIQHIGQSMQNIDSKTLIKILFGSNKLYNYKLQLNEALDLPLYRQRNFSISLKLTDLQGRVVKNNNKIPLSLAIYSSENPPKFIEKNTAGQKILKGYIQQSLHFGQCRFEKIQIKQVTSHFRNGWVFIVIIPCMTPLGSATLNQNFIDYLKVQPLVLQKVVVKAKKIKQAVKKDKSEKQEKQESEAAQLKDSQFEVASQKVGSKEKINVDKGNDKVKKESNEQNSQDIFQDK